MTDMTTTSLGVNDLASALRQRPRARVIVGAHAGRDGVSAARSAMALNAVLGIDAADLTTREFTGRRWELCEAVVSAPDGTRLTVVVVGLGSPGVLSDADVFHAAVASAGDGATLSLLALDGDTQRAAAMAAEGHAIGRWRYGRSNADIVDGTHANADAGTDDLVVVGETAAAPSEFERATRVADAVNWVRRLVETPANLLGPVEFADEIVAFADRTPGVEARVWSTQTASDHGFGATLAVGAGSRRSPAVVELKTTGDRPVVGLAGKGIVFDAGGIDLKRDQQEISWMKTDMAAAASVAAAALTAVALGTPYDLHVILPVAENLPGGDALRPGDVIGHPGGRTTEVLDTDCEGRLVLADAVAWLSATAPAMLIDVGTLTDSGALGTAYWGCWGSSTGLAASLVSHGTEVGDPGWHLPLHRDYDALLTSRVADSANTSFDVPDTGVIAATFLRPFAGDVPWVHIDNGSSAWLERPGGAWQSGPTGTPTRALIEFLTASPTPEMKDARS